MADHERSGMTLIELMVAVAIGMAMIALTWTSFVRAKSAIARTTARVDLHASAALLEDALRRDLSNVAPALAFFARSTVANPDADTRTEMVELVFMRVASPLDKLNAVPGAYDSFLADHHWVRWRFTRTLKLQPGPLWRFDSGVLARSASTPNRVWKTTATHTVSPVVTDPSITTGITTRSHYGGVLWLNIPRPLRDATTWGVDGLQHNTYGVPLAKVDPATPIGDVDDLADLDANERTASTQVRSFLVGWSDAGGRSFTVSGASPSDERRNGLYMDVVGPENGRYASAGVTPAVAGPQYDYKPDLADRPRIIRVALGMYDQGAELGQDFAFSVATPGSVPAVVEPSP